MRSNTQKSEKPKKEESVPYEQYTGALNTPHFHIKWQETNGVLDIFVYRITDDGKNYEIPNAFLLGHNSLRFEINERE